MGHSRECSEPGLGLTLHNSINVTIPTSPASCSSNPWMSLCVEGFNFTTKGDKVPIKLVVLHCLFQSTLICGPCEARATNFIRLCTAFFLCFTCFCFTAPHDVGYQHWCDFCVTLGMTTCILLSCGAICSHGEIISAFPSCFLSEFPPSFQCRPQGFRSLGLLINHPHSLNHSVFF